MKVLVGVLSYKGYRDGGGYQKVVRDTWMGKWKHLVDARFFLGQGNENAEADEWIFPVDDTFDGLPRKHQAAFKRALDEGYDYAFTTALDTYVIVPRLLQVELGLHQYFGSTCEDGGLTWVGGGGIWTGRQAMEAIVREPPSNSSWPDDWMGRVLKKSNILPHTDRRYWYNPQNDDVFPYHDPKCWEIDTTVAHLGRGTGMFKPEWMYDCHRSYLDAHPDPAL